MAEQIYVIYEKINPFPGWIRFYGKVDPNEVPDGSTLQERLDALLIKYPDTDVYLFPLSTTVNPEAQKFKQSTSTLVPLVGSNITPDAQKDLDKTQETQDAASDYPNWGSVVSEIAQAFSDPKQKALITKLVRNQFWRTRGRPI